MNVGLASILLTGYCPEAQSVFNAMTTSPNGTRKKAIDTLIRTLKSIGVWDNCDAIYVLAAADSQAAYLNWKVPTQTALNPVNAPTFTADLGSTGNGTNASLDGPVNVTTYTKFVQNNVHLSVYNLTNTSVAGYTIGTQTTQQLGIRPRDGGNVFASLVNSGSSTTIANSVGVGHFMTNRTGANLNSMYKNGLSVATGVTGSGSPPAEPLCIHHMGSSWGTNQIAYASIGSNLEAQALDYYNAVRAYLITVCPQGTVL